MDAELKQEWINRLLSDEYTQCVGVLSVYDKDSKLYNDAWGILLDLAIEKQFPGLGWDFTAHIDEPVTYHFTSGPTMERYPSYQLLEALEIPYNAGPSADIRNYLCGLNDSGSNFIYIAGEISEYVPSG